MTALAHGGEVSSRRRYQSHVAALLEEIVARRLQLLLLHANGAQAPALRELKAELRGVRNELAATVEQRPVAA